MALGGEAVCEGVCAEDRRPTPGGATSGTKFVQANPIKPASAASLA